MRFDRAHLCRYNIPLRIEFDPDKRALILAKRGLDLADAAEVFAGPAVTIDDDRQDYGESRFVTMDWLRGRMVVLVWTPRAGARRIISMRKANDREQAKFGPRLVGPG